jgi:hypothetical protein
MSYSRTIWVEHSMNESQKIAALNNLETQYDASIAAVIAHRHDSIYFTKSEANSRFFGASNDGVGSGANAGTLDGYTADAISSSSIAPGFIVMYAGTDYALPGGWEEYAAANGKFPVGAGATYAVKTVGGNQMTGSPLNPHGTISGFAMDLGTMPPHTHTFTQYYNPKVDNRAVGTPTMYCYVNASLLTHTGYAYDDVGGTAAGASHSHECTVSLNSIDHTPPNVILRFLKKS